MWANFSPDLEKIIDTLEEVVDATEAKPYDPVSEVPMDEQKLFCTFLVYLYFILIL